MSIIIRSVSGNIVKGGVSTGSCSNIVAKTRSQGILLNWTDPEDAIDSEQLGGKWDGTQVIRKEGKVPQNEKDGKLVIDSKIRNAYSAEGYLDTDVIDDVCYYYRLFPYSKDGTYDYSVKNIVKVTKKGYRVLGCRFRAAAIAGEIGTVEYTDDAVGMTPDSREWDDFFGYYPCLFKAGEETGVLNAHDFSKFVDGSSADITSGDMGDVMIAYPRMGVRITTEDGYIYIKMTDNPADNEFDYYAHTRGDVRKDKFYLGTYINVDFGGKLRSLSGYQKKSSEKYPGGISGVGNRARANGDGYFALAFYQMLFLRCMYILKYKSMNDSLGFPESPMDYNTGNADKDGMNHKPTPENPVDKLFGLEDLRGIRNEMEGIYNNNGNIYASTEPLPYQGAMELIAKITRPEGTSSVMGAFNGFVTELYGTSKTGFLPKTHVSIYDEPVAYFFSRYLYFENNCGAALSDNIVAQQFLSASSSATQANTRLMYL